MQKILFQALIEVNHQIHRIANQHAACLRNVRINIFLFNYFVRLFDAAHHAQFN